MIIFIICVFIFSIIAGMVSFFTNYQPRLIYGIFRLLEPILVMTYTTAILLKFYHFGLWIIVPAIILSIALTYIGYYEISSMIGTKLLVAYLNKKPLKKK